MLNVGGAELLILLLVALIFLGPQRLPEVARQLGQAISSLRSLAAGFQAEIEAATKPDHAASMKLDGPTAQADAIAATQQGTDP
ncbi:MAG: Tat protein translocase TatB subunit, partial [Paracrocinitomix sp.]